MTGKAATPYLFSLPALLFIGGLFMLPIFQMIALSLMQEGPSGESHFSLQLYTEMLSDSYFMTLLWRTVKVSLMITGICIVIAFPVALFLRELTPKWQSIFGFLLLSPLMTSVVVRTLAWVILLSPRGVINTTLESLGISPVSLIYNETGVIIGLTHVLVGYMVLSLMTSVSKLDENLLLAASNLGARPFTIFREIIFPLCLPGLLAGSVLVFTMSASAYATPVLLGGARSKVVATEVYDLAIHYLEWEKAAALACILFLVIAASVLLATFLLERVKGKAVFD